LIFYKEINISFEPVMHCTSIVQALYVTIFK
jgi:hypothetical protein